MPDLMFRLGADGRYREVINPPPGSGIVLPWTRPGRAAVSRFWYLADIANRKLTMKDQALANGANWQLYEQQMQTDTGPPRYEEVRVIKK